MTSATSKTFLFGCIADQNINYLKIQHGQKACQWIFSKVQNVMTVIQSKCEASLKSRVIIYPFGRNEYVFSIENATGKGKLKIVGNQ